MSEQSSSMLENHSPLAGVRVLDLTTLVPGPYCSRILTEFGAEVIKIEPPGGGDWLRHTPPFDEGESVLFRMLNQGKKSLMLDLKTERGREIFRELAQTADVVLEGFRPGVMDRLGLGYETLREGNPRLVYCSLSGYGQQGPYRDRAGHDLNYIGLAGLLDLTGRPDSDPVVPGTLIADLAGSLWAALGILTALIGRGQSGAGSRIDGSLLGAALSFLPVAVGRQAGGQPMMRGGSDLTGGAVCYNVYPTADGCTMTLGALEPKFWSAFCERVERPDLIDQQYAPALAGEPAFEALTSLFRSRSRQEWVEIFSEVDACCEPVYSVAEALDASPVQALEMWSAGMLHAPVVFSAWTRSAAGVPPAPGQHTSEILSELGIEAEEISTLREAKIV